MRGYGDLVGVSRRPRWGESEFAGRLARKYHWQSMVLVTTTPQDTRARLRVERCFSGPFTS
jgi:hypothetical protein